MRKFFLFALLFAATAVMAETKVETFTTKDGSATNTYVTTVTTKECQQASWTFFSGGILKNLGDMGSTNFAAVIRAKKNTEEVYPYIESNTIDGGIDSLWFTWNSNGNETGGTWNVVIYINGDSVGAITGAGGPKAASPFNKYGIGNLGITGEFTIKFVNESPYSGTGNSMRFVFDDLSWEPKAAAGEKTKPTFEFAEESYLKMVDAVAFTNTLTNTSDATPAFESSNTAVATVAENGEVTIKGVGTTTITATIAETATYKAAEASYTIRVVPLNFNMETFTGAMNVTGNNTYVTTPTESPASEATGLTWTTLLGSVRHSLAGAGTTEMAAVIRSKKSAEEDYGYLLSSTIEGGIDSIAFDWSCNGNESTRNNPWNIEIYINDEKIATIDDACTAVPAQPYRFSKGNLKVDGDFTIKIVNKNDADGTGNEYRWVVDNIEWYSYEAPCETSYGILVGGTDYIAGEYNEAQTSWLEYKIVADLEQDQTFVFYDKCNKAGFLAGQEEGGYWFTIDGDLMKAPAKGKYTIYLKMYGPDNNWIWTSYEAPAPTGIDNTVVRYVRKEVVNGQLIITVDGVRYSAQGQVL